MPVQSTDRFRQAVKEKWGHPGALAVAALDEIWAHPGEVSHGEDHDEQVSDALKIGTLVGQMMSTDPDQFIKAFEILFLYTEDEGANEERRMSWWGDGMKPEDILGG